MIAPLIEGVTAHLNALQTFHKSQDHVRAPGEAEHAKKLLQELYYEIWLAHHISGTGK